MFLLSALPVFMRQQGNSLEAIGLLSLFLLPMMLKFAWSPLIDRYGFTRWGHYRFWIICFRLLITCTTVACAWLDIKYSFNALLICLLLMCFFCASQDIATDALAVGLLEPYERGLGNGVQTSGHYLGAVIGGGGMLILLNHWGWTVSLLTLALIVVVALIPVLWHKENSSKNREVSHSTPALMNLVNFCRRPEMWRWLLILVLSTAGETMAGTMFRPLLVDIGLSLAEIGLLLGVVSYSAGMLGAMTAGLFINPLGRKRSLIVFGLLEAITLAT